jgi:monofunctional biosynthetic peptidoglycan transglycosylase
VTRRLVLLDFADPAAAAAFAPIDDVVMGGRSWSRALPAEGALRFEGEVSLEQGGGFASIRSRPRRADLAAFAGLALTVRGDGRRYKVNLRIDEAFDGVTWQAPLEPPAGAWCTVTLPFAAFAPRFRGRAVPEAGPLDPARIATLGFLVGDRQAGPFRLEVARVEAVPAPPHREASP